MTNLDPLQEPDGGSGFMGATASRGSSSDFVMRMKQMRQATGLRKEVLERATYLHAMQDEGLSVIEWQAMETLYRCADAAGLLLASLNEALIKQENDSTLWTAEWQIWAADAREAVRNQSNEGE